jgi:hypothetical protein
MGAISELSFWSLGPWQDFFANILPHSAAVIGDLITILVDSIGEIVSF